jgi:hypothetical protein
MTTVVGEQWLFIDIYFFFSLILLNPKNNYFSLCYISGHKLEMTNALDESYIKYRELNKGDFNCVQVSSIW